MDSEERMRCARFFAELLENELILSKETEKLLKEIRAEIKYAETSLDYGNLLPAYLWNIPAKSKQLLQNEDEKKKSINDRESSLEGRKCDTNDNLKRLSNASSASETSINKSCHLVESWANSLEDLLGDPIGLRCFQEFLKKEFSEENIQFWIACEDFRKIKDIEKMKLEANSIFQEYLASSSKSLVNVNQSSVKIVEDSLQNPHTDMFATPQNQVFHLMKFDSYNRFLKSDLYKECLEAERSDKRLPYEEENSTLSRKSKSPIPDFTGDWKRQILNFLSKGGKRSDIKGLRKEFTIGDGGNEDGNEINLSNNFFRHNSLKENQLWDGLHSQSKGNFLRVFFPDGTSSMVVAENGSTLKDKLKDTCKSKKLSLTSFDVTMGVPRKIVSLEQEVSKLNEKVVFLEKRILFRFDLPNGRSVGIKANPNKTLNNILSPVMKRNGFDIQDYSIHIMNNKPVIPLDASILTVENKRLTTRKLHKKLEKQLSDTSTLRGSGSDLRSSLRRLRTNSFNKEEKQSKQESKKDEKDESSRTFGNEVKHILLGRTKSEDGTSALMSALTRSQSSRMDDQRGLLPSDLELPDFLKRAPPTTTSEHSVPPSPRDSINSVTCSPSKSIPCPPSPLIIDKMTDSNRSPLLLRSLNSGLFSVTSWKEVASPDRELVDKSYTNTLSSDGYDSQSKPSLLELSRSDPALSKEPQNKYTISNSNHNITNSNQSSKERLNNSLENEQDAFEIVGIDDISSSLQNDTPTSTPKHVTRLGSIDLINYDLSPREITKRRTLDPFEEEVNEPVFRHNAVPTPEKAKFLQGETVLGRKNEKISYV